MSKPAQTPQAVAVNFRKAVPPEPKIYAQCRNCVHLVYDSDDRCSSRGELLLRKVNLRCKPGGFKVVLGAVCDQHNFAYESRGDR